jgi:hypothetical protein
MGMQQLSQSPEHEKNVHIKSPATTWMLPIRSHPRVELHTRSRGNGRYIGAGEHHLRELKT